MEHSKIIETIMNYIETHLDNELSLDKISKDLNYSKFYISRVFSENTGISIYKYIQRRRLTIAAQKLVETNKPIIDIAYEAQYNSQQAFTLAFHQLYVCTPQTYRKNGIFYPKQLRKTTQSTLLDFSSINCTIGGRMVA